MQIVHHTRSPSITPPGDMGFKFEDCASAVEVVEEEEEEEEGVRLVEEVEEADLRQRWW